MDQGKNRKWTAETVKAEILDLYQKRQPLFSHHMRMHHQTLLAAAIRYYGSWQKAVEAAGFKYDSFRRYRRWTKETIIEEIKALHVKGVDLSFRSMMLSEYNTLVYAAIRPNHFGAWKNALDAAGLSSREIYRYRSWDEQTILEEIRKLHANGMDLSSKAMDQTANSLVATARRKFGSWAQAVAQAGIDYSKVRLRHRWTKEEILEGIRKLHAEGSSLLSSEVRKKQPALFAAACKPHFFGSWSNAVYVATGSTNPNHRGTVSPAAKEKAGEPEVSV